MRTFFGCNNKKFKKKKEKQNKKHTHTQKNKCGGSNMAEGSFTKRKQMKNSLARCLAARDVINNIGTTITF